MLTQADCFFPGAIAGGIAGAATRFVASAVTSDKSGKEFAWDIAAGALGGLAQGAIMGGFPMAWAPGAWIGAGLGGAINLLNQGRNANNPCFKLNVEEMIGAAAGGALGGAIGGRLGSAIAAGTASRSGASLPGWIAELPSAGIGQLPESIGKGFGERRADRCQCR